MRIDDPAGTNSGERRWRDVLLMPSTLGVYVFRHFLLRVALCAPGLSAILLVFDLLANADDVTQSGHVALPMLYYGLLRLPEIFVLVLPLAALVAAMASLGQLAMRQEMIAAMAGGMPPARIAGSLLLAGALLGVAQFAVVNLLIPDTSAELRLWANTHYAGLPKDAESQRMPAWFSAGGTLIHAGGAAPHGHVLTRVTLLERDADGHLVSHLEAERATYHHDRLMLEKVTRERFDAGGAVFEPGVLDELTLPLSLRPGELAILSDTVQELRLGELRKMHRAADASERIEDFYAVSWLRRLAQPASVPAMILPALPLVFQLPRRNRLSVAMAVILAAGFVYLIAEQLMLALGEGGHLPPWIAAWLPLFLLAAIVGLLWQHLERPGRSGGKATA